MRTHPLLVALAIATIALPRLATAQAAPLSDLAPGARLRLTVRDSARVGPLQPRQTVFVATLVRATADSLVVQPIGGTGPVAYARAGALRHVEASRGVSRTRSIVMQVVGNAIGFGITGYVLADRGERGRVAGTWAGLGAGIGAVFGGLSPYEEWRRVRP